jgi:transcription termination factor Rho
MLSTTTLKRESSKFRGDNLCCNYIFINDNVTNIPFIDINEILDTPYNSQREILLPPNLEYTSLSESDIKCINLFRRGSEIKGNVVKNTNENNYNILLKLDTITESYKKILQDNAFDKIKNYNKNRKRIIKNNKSVQNRRNTLRNRNNV